MMKTATDPCVTPEVVAAYLDNGLSPRERCDVEDHLAECRPCLERLASAFKTMRELRAALRRAYPSHLPPMMAATEVLAIEAEALDTLATLRRKLMPPRR